MADTDEDDYLSMTFAEPAKPAKESSIAKAARLKREAAERGRVLSKTEQAKQEEEKRNAGLNTKLQESNKGAKLMAKMGYAGGALGAGGTGRENPIELSFKIDRGGIGMDNEKKRKIREEAEARDLESKRSKLTEDEYRERARQEREDARAEGQWRGAMKVLEGLDEQAEQTPDELSARPIKSINLLYRPIVLERRLAEQRKRDMKSIYEDRKSLGDPTDPELDEDDRLAVIDESFDDLTEHDEELDEYERQPSTEKLERVVQHLRTTYNYCFWCKYRYEDSTMDGCPGLTEDEHG